jgi:flagellar basal body L-ring protein FlgH
MAARVTTKDVLAAVKDVINSVEANSPNGDIKDLSSKVETLCEAQKQHSKKQEEQFADVQSTILKLTKRLYNPDDGIVITVKDNTRVTKETRDTVKRYASKIEKIDDDVSAINSWKSNINKTLWITLPIILSGVVYAAKVILGGQ